MEPCVHPHHQGPPASVTPSHIHSSPLTDSAHTHSPMSRADQHITSNEMAYQSVASAPTSALVEMLSRIDALEAIPRLQVCC